QCEFRADHFAGQHAANIPTRRSVLMVGVGRPEGRQIMTPIRLVGVVVAIVLAGTAVLPRQAASTAPEPAGIDWPVYRGDPGANPFSTRAELNARNVHLLQPAWEYRTGDAAGSSTMYVNPVVVGRTMYVTTPSLRAVALD